MPDLTAKKKRPLWFDLNLFNLPLPGIVSILHRASGALLFLATFWMLFLFERSLASAEQFDYARHYLGLPLVKLALLVLLWSYLHHFCAGIRYLFLDIDLGTALPAARKTSYAVLVVSLVLTVALGAKLW